VSHLQVGEGEQVHIPAGRVHSVATLGPRVCLSLYSTAAFGKGKEDKRKKKVMDNAADKEMADESTKKYQRLKRKYQKEKKQAKDAEDPQNPTKKHQKKEKKNRK
jgi:ribulose kinase